MPSTEELILKYKEYSHDQIISAYAKKEDYSEEGKAAIISVIEEKGGLDYIVGILQKEEQIEQEKETIRREIYRLLKNKTFNPSFKDTAQVQFINREQIEQLILETNEIYSAEENDKKIKLRTLLGGIIGAAIGGTISGIVWGLQMIYTGYMIYLLAVGLALLCYACVKFFTKQSYRNSAVFIFTAIACFYALVLGQILFEYFGYLGAERVN